MDHSIIMPHGVCLLWKPSLVWLHVITDSVVALSYYSIPAALFWMVARRRESVPAQPLLLLFGLFIAFCGGGHALDVIAIWKPIYWAKGIWNIGTALTSALTAIVLIPKVVEYVRMPETTERLRQETTVLNALLDSVSEAIVLVGEGGRVRLFNAAAQRTLAPQGGTPSVDWHGHPPTAGDVVQRSDGRILERFTTLVPGHGQLYVIRDVTDDRKREAQRLRLERIISTMKQGFNIVSAETGEILATNPSFDRMMGYQEGELTGESIALVNAGTPEEQQQVVLAIREAVIQNGYWEGELVNRRKDGTDFHSTARVNLHTEGNERYLSTIQMDITEQKRLEEERERLQKSMLHAQKLESLGVLAGGIAHDFNNLLTGIMGNASVVQETLPQNHPAQARLVDVVKASERAADLTRQLLAYAGKGRFLIEHIDLSQAVAEASALLRSSVQRTVSLRFDLANDLPSMEGDPSQIQQIVMNLVINGAEAIGEHAGEVCVSTRAHSVDGHYLRQAEIAENLPAGTYLVLEVSDTGSGMDPQTISQIFDPFFTTKFTGRGLGLAAAQGIARGHRGAIKVYSTPGQGTTFKVLFPAAAGEAPLRGEAQIPADLSGSGTVLVVDDEEIVLRTAKAALERHGYTVLLAGNGKEGLDLFRAAPDRIALVVLDMTMPVMSGQETLRELRRIRADVRVLLSSGFNELEAVRRFAGQRLAGFIQKPYTSGGLAKRVKEVLTTDLEFPSGGRPRSGT